MSEILNRYGDLIDTQRGLCTTEAGLTPDILSKMNELAVKLKLGDVRTYRLTLLPTRSRQDIPIVTLDDDDRQKRNNLVN